MVTILQATFQILLTRIYDILIQLRLSGGNVSQITCQKYLADLRNKKHTWFILYDDGILVDTYGPVT